MRNFRSFPYLPTLPPNQPFDRVNLFNACREILGGYSLTTVFFFYTNFLAQEVSTVFTAYTYTVYALELIL